MYSLHTSILEGDIRLDATWRLLDDVFRGRFYRKSGVTMPILAACVDAGDGKISEVVIDYCRKRRASNIYAVKGSSERVSAWGEIWPGVKAKKTRETGFRVKMIGSNAAKMAIYTRLGQREGSGTMHFGMDWDKNRFHQLIAEKLVHSKRGGFTVRKFVLPRGRANEALDGTAYALTACLGWIAHGHSLERNAKAIANAESKDG